MQKLTVNGKDLVARELTLQELERVLQSLVADTVPHPLELECPDEPIPALALEVSVGVPLDELMELLPSQVPELFRMVREVNPSLARRMIGLAEIGRKIMAADSQPDSTGL